MTDDQRKGPRTLDEVYALIDTNRIDAAGAAQAKFHHDIETAIATIANIGSVAGARVLADSRVASAKVLINAELAATRLLADAEMQASKCVNQVLIKPREVVEAAILEVGKLATWRLTATARESVEAIHQDAEFAINALKETGAHAIREIQALAAKVDTQTKHDAEQAAAKLKQFRERPRTMDEATSEGHDAAQIVIKAARHVSVGLQTAVKVSIAEINSVTEAACSAVHDAAVAAEEKIIEGRERALLRLRETLQAHLG